MRPTSYSGALTLLAALLVAIPAAGANAQRGGRAGTRAPAATPRPPSQSGVAVTPGPGYGVPRRGPGIDYRGQQLPRLQTGPRYGRPYGYDPRYPGSSYDRYDRYGRYDRYDSFDRLPDDSRFDRRFRSSRYRPFKCLGACGPVVLLGAPYVVGGVVYERHEVSSYGTAAYDARDEAAPNSRLIVVGGGGNAGETLTVEQLGDTALRVSWLPDNRPAREVSLFVADSAQQPLVTQRLAPAAPTAIFQTTRLAAPIAYIGATVMFADSVRTTTLVPYPRQ